MAPRFNVHRHPVGRHQPPSFVVVGVCLVQCRIRFTEQRMVKGMRGRVGAEFVFDGGPGGFGDVDEGDVDGRWVPVLTEFAQWHGWFGYVRGWGMGSGMGRRMRLCEANGIGGWCHRRIVVFGHCDTPITKHFLVKGIEWGLG